MEEHILRFLISVLKDETWDYPKRSNWRDEDRLRELADEFRSLVLR